MQYYIALFYVIVVVIRRHFAGKKTIGLSAANRLYEFTGDKAILSDGRWQMPEDKISWVPPQIWQNETTVYGPFHRNMIIRQWIYNDLHGVPIFRQTTVIWQGDSWSLCQQATHFKPSQMLHVWYMFTVSYLHLDDVGVNKLIHMPFMGHMMESCGHV